MNYFICDVVGTFEGRSESRLEETSRLVSNLEKLMETDEIDNLTFCFSTSEDFSEMKESISEIETLLKETNIKIGPHFSYDQVLVDGKIKRASQGKLFHLVDLLGNEDVKNIYIADSTISIQNLITDLLEPSLKKAYQKEHGTLDGFKCYERLIQFIPGMVQNDDRFIGSSVTSIVGLNEALERYCEIKKEQKVYRID